MKIVDFGRKITWDEIKKIAKPGDKLRGHFIQSDHYSFSREVEELTFWECIDCLADKEDVYDGTDYFLQLKHDNYYEKMEVIK